MQEVAEQLGRALRAGGQRSAVRGEAESHGTAGGRSGRQAPLGGTL